MTEPRELVEKMRQTGHRLDENPLHTGYMQGTSDTLLWCADELEQALDENVERRPNANVYEVTDD